MDRAFAEQKVILDPCCGSRMMWFNSQNPMAVFGDCRAETISVPDRSHGRSNGSRVISIEPDTVLDFRALPFPDGSFRLVAFDPPHLVRAGKRSWLAAKYGKLSANWRDDLRRGFMECFRVLAPLGTLIFKWSEIQISVSEIIALSPHPPLFGNRRVGKDKSHWLVFMAPENV